MNRKSFIKMMAAAATLSVVSMASPALANGLLVSGNNTTRLGINDDGSLDASTVGGFVGLGYNFTGQAGRTGFQDALTPGCACEAWGVSAGGVGGQVGQTTGNQNISVGASTTAAGTFTSNTTLTGTGLSISQVYTLSNQNSSGALFQNTVTLTNTTGATLTDVRYTRAMDWDVPPTEFSEYVTFKGTGTTASLIRATNDGFANANPLTAALNTGRNGVPINTDGTFGPYDHGSLFTFGFGDLAAGESYTFNIFYGAAGDEAGALNLLSAISPELYSLGQSSYDGRRRSDLPTFIFAFNGVGGTVVVPPSGVPEPATWAMMIAGFGLAGASLRRRKTAVSFA